MALLAPDIFSFGVCHATNYSHRHDHANYLNELGDTICYVFMSIRLVRYKADFQLETRQKKWTNDSSNTLNFYRIHQKTKYLQQHKTQKF